MGSSGIVIADQPVVSTRFLQRVPGFLFSWVVAVMKQTRTSLGDWLRATPLSNRRLALVDRNKLGDGTWDCLQSIIDELGDEVMIVGPDFRIRQVNSAMLRRLGTTLAVAVVGRPCYRVTRGEEEPCRSPWCECPLGSVLETGQSVRVVHSYRESGVDEDSIERWVEIVVSPVRDGSGNITEVIEIMKDVSENRRLQRQNLRASRELLALNSISEALIHSLDLNVVLQAVAETMLDALEAQVCWIKLLGDASRVPVVRASRGLSAEVLDELMEAIHNVGASELAATSANYSMVSADGAEGHDQTLWQFTVTPLKSKGVVLGMAGVAATKRPVDQQRIQLLDAIGNQIAVAVERCILHEQVQIARDLRGELLHRVITTQEEERRRIARELHDETGQALTALRLSLERLALAPASNIEELKARLAQPLSLCQQAEEEVDKLIFDLRPALLDDLGLVEAARFYAEVRLKTMGIKVSFKIIGNERGLGSEREVALFRVIQESITNIVKHAHARNVVVRLHFRRNQLVARIEDDGCGFQESRIAGAQSSGESLGLLGMRERMGLAGGNLTITSKPGVGTSIEASVPLAENRVWE